MNEAGEKRLSYVDGALPWIAEVGETASYAECVADDGSGEIYEVERTAREIEYVHGRRLKHRELVEATVKSLPKARLPYQDAVEQKRGFKLFLKVAIIATLVNLFLWVLGRTRRNRARQPFQRPTTDRRDPQRTLRRRRWHCSLPFLMSASPRPKSRKGVSLRQESASRGGFFYGYRQHRGGGLHGGK